MKVNKSEYTEEELVAREMAKDLRELVFDPAKYTDNPDIHFMDVRNELYRTYYFPPLRPGEPLVEFRIDNPEAVAFKAPQGVWTAGGSHRVIDKNGKAWYVPSGWVGIGWEKNSGLQAYEW
jgi:hypothetical protein